MSTRVPAASTEPLFDDLVLLAAQICAAPIGALALIDGERQWFEARSGAPIGATPRELSFGDLAIASGEPVFVIEDAPQDARFRDHPLVTGAPHIRFYAGVPIALPGGLAAGTLCIVDTEARALDAAQSRALQALARQAAALLERRATQGKLELLARVDALTGLPNRRQFDERIRDAMLRSRRTMRPVAVMLLDIDHFKAVNAAHGQGAGDTVLREFARRLEASVRATDMVARLAGDEFAIVLEGVDGVLELGRLAEKIVAGIRPRFEITDALLTVTASAGLAIYRGTEQSVADVLSLADVALKRAKQQGRDRFSLA